MHPCPLEIAALLRAARRDKPASLGISTAGTDSGIPTKNQRDRSPGKRSLTSPLRRSSRNDTPAT
jgi:hypothetical protein